MMLRELTFGFDFRSCGHLRMAVMHHPTKFGAYIYFHCGDISISRHSRSLLSAILHLLGSMVMRTPVKFRDDQLYSFQVLRI